ncbi:MAG: VIT1/CCC1 transporter family protein [archaeon]
MHFALEKRRKIMEKHSKIASLFREFILGGQDGLVNVLGIILGLAVATHDVKIVIIAGLAATFAESISMGAVAFTSTRAVQDYYRSEEARERYEMKHFPKVEREEIYDLYRKRGFKGSLLNAIVRNITSSKERWLDVMMKEELGLTKEFVSPLKAAFIVMTAAFIGSFIPLTPFFFMTINNAIILSLAVSAVALFITGAIEAKMTVGNVFFKGIQLMIIGMLAALAGFIIGKIFGFSG